MKAKEQQTISAIYEEGQFRPLEPASLPEHTRVKLTFEVAEDSFKTEDERIRAIFAAAGVPLVPRPAKNGRRPMTAKELDAFAQQIAPSRPIAEIIDDDRDGI